MPPHPSLTSVFIRICLLYLTAFSKIEQSVYCVFHYLLYRLTSILLFCWGFFCPPPYAPPRFLLRTSFASSCIRTLWLQIKSELQSGVKEMTADSSLIMPLWAAGREQLCVLPAISLAQM